MSDQQHQLGVVTEPRFKDDLQVEGANRAQAESLSAERSEESPFLLNGQQYVNEDIEPKISATETQIKGLAGDETTATTNISQQVTLDNPSQDQTQAEAKVYQSVLDKQNSPDSWTVTNLKGFVYWLNNQRLNSENEQEKNEK